MGEILSISIEGENAKIIKAIRKGKTISVSEYLTISVAEELDEFLAREPSKELFVTYDFREAFHDIITIPLVSKKYQKKIIESEIRKTTGLSQFSYIYRPVRERVRENKRVMEVFFYAVSNYAIREIVDKFYLNGKIIKALYPGVFVVASLLRDMGGVKMGITGTGLNKIIYLTDEKGVFFIRNYESIDEELSEFDIQNINMTMNYCFQNFRINPDAVVIVGNLCRNVTASTIPAVPILSKVRPSNIICPDDRFAEYFLPISALLTPSNSNILSGDYRNINIIDHLIKYATRTFAGITIIGILFIIAQAVDISKKKDHILELKQKNKKITSLYREYKKREDLLNNITPLVNFLNRPFDDIHGLFTGICSISPGNLEIKEIHVKRLGDHSYSALIKGRGYDESYSMLRDSFTKYIQELRSIKGVSISSQILDLSDRSITIDLTYRVQNEVF